MCAIGMLLVEVVELGVEVVGVGVEVEAVGVLLLLLLYEPLSIVAGLSPAGQ
jgi:hypothetical protein